MKSFASPVRSTCTIAGLFTCGQFDVDADITGQRSKTGCPHGVVSDSHSDLFQPYKQYIYIFTMQTI